MVIDRNAAVSGKPEKSNKKADNKAGIQQADAVKPTETDGAPAQLPIVQPPSVPTSPSMEVVKVVPSASGPVRVPQPEAPVKQVNAQSVHSQQNDFPEARQGVNEPLPVIRAPAASKARQPAPVQAPVLAQQPKQGAAATVNAGDEASPVTTINGEQYIQSEYLEQKEFNLEGKKRFYAVPNVFGGTQVLEREKGVDMNVFRGPKVEAPRVVSLSKDYQRLDASQVVGLTGVQCFTEKQLEKAKLLKPKATLDFWPRPSFEPRFDFVIAEFESSISDIELTSYAATSRNPVFYWPLPIFLDQNACVMEGVNAFYQRNIAANSLQHQALQGFLHVPKGARYLLLTPLESAADLSGLKLTNKGQIRLTPIR